MFYNIFFNSSISPFFYLFCKMKLSVTKIVFGRIEKYAIYVVFILIFAYFYSDASAIGFAPIRNFSRQNYGAGSQNWDVQQDHLGRVWFGNRDGLLSFDGSRWQLFRLPNYTTVRSVKIDHKSGRIYVGGSGEFGYFEVTQKIPRPHYVSLSERLPANQRDFSEIWNIHILDNGAVLFQGDYKLFVAESDGIKVIPVGEKITTTSKIDTRIYIALQTGELKVLENGAVQTAPGTEPLLEKRIVGILPMKDGGLMIATSVDGLFSYKEGTLSPLSMDITPFLKTNQIFSATHSGDDYAFGTVNNGAVVKNLSDGRATYINKETGLQDNTVLNLGFDFTGDLWLCLDNGISYGLVDSPVYNFLSASGDAGAGYASLLSANRLFLGTNRGLYSTDIPTTNSFSPPTLQRILSGQVWSIDSIGSDIFFSTDNGIYQSGRAGGTPVKIPDIDIGTWSILPLRSDGGREEALVSTYNGFYRLSKNGGRWQNMGKVEGYEDVGGRFYQDSEGYIWIAHWIKGVYRLHLSSEGDRFDSVKLFTSREGLPADRDNSIFLQDGQIKFSTASGGIYYPASSGKIVKDEKLSKNLPLKYPAHIIPVSNGTFLALSQELSWKIQKKADGNYSIDSISLKPLSNSLIPGFEHVGSIGENRILVSNQEGFFSIDLDNIKRRNWSTPVFVESLFAGDSLIFSSLPPDFIPEIRLPYQLNSITFNFASPEYRFENGVLYSYRLENYDSDWSLPSGMDSKEYTKLTEGDYIFHLRAYNSVTGEISQYSLPFKIRPPWYRSVIAWIIYALLILGAIFAAFRLVRYYSQRSALKVKRQKEEEMERLRREAEREAMLKDYEIASLKSDQLEQDIKHKSSELSNITMNVIRKNEILLDISAKLKKLHYKAAVDSATEERLKREVDKILEIIKANISHDDDWKRFNQNFDIVYADFTQHLSELHPGLTVAELRLCCYLKMGLSSKEIAPLFNISTKSVEMNRYRLRKKMGLGQGDNLTAYLQKI